MGLDGETNRRIFDLLREGGFELLHRDQVVLLRAGENLNRDTAREPDGLRVGGPERRGNNHFVARIHQRGERVVHGLLAAVGHQYLGRVHGVAGIAQGLLGDGFLQLRQAAGGGVAVVLGLAGSLDGRLHDVVRGGEIRFARAEANDRPAGCLQRLGLGINGQGCGFGNGGYALGNAGGRHGGSVLRLQPGG